MAKALTKIETGYSGEHLANLRKQAGFTQTELASELQAVGVEVTRRMIAYYESESEYPPTSLLAGLAKVLGRSLDEVLATTPVKAQAKAKASDTRLHRRLQQIEKLAPTEKRQIMQLIDAFIERGQLKRKATRQSA
jgi:transcriptional regulator with XRE-family HTH domain